MSRPISTNRKAIVSSILWLGLLVPATARAQETDTASGFDLDRAFVLDSTTYKPFYVTQTRPLQQALDDGMLNAATPLLVMQHSAGTLAFAVDQLAYHHIAQGEIAGEPWMVSF